MVDLFTNNATCCYRGCLFDLRVANSATCYYHGCLFDVRVAHDQGLGGFCICFARCKHANKGKLFGVLDTSTILKLQRTLPEGRRKLNMRDDRHMQGGEHTMIRDNMWAAILEGIFLLN